MNSVSWFIYIAQVAGSLGAMFMAFGIIGLIGIGIYFLVGSIVQSIESGDNWKPITVQMRYLVAVIGFIFIGNLMPEKNTMYAIAASQVGEQIIKDETVKGVASDATLALRQWIARQIDPVSKK
jgi:hypothetical protein